MFNGIYRHKSLFLYGKNTIQSDWCLRILAMMTQP